MAEPSVSIPTQVNGLLPVPTERTYKARDGNVAQKLTYDVSAYGLNEVRKLLVDICAEEMQHQISIDNPPAFADVDDTRGKGIANAQKKVVISFGMRLKVQALNELKAGLKSAIAHSTSRVSGKLADMSNWQFRYVRGGKVTPLPISGASGIPMGPNDFIVLMPVGVINQKGQAYGTAANKRVAGAGSLTFRRTANGRPRKKDQGIGFLALVSRAAAASSSFGGFNVLSGFTTKYKLAGEVVGAHKSNKGTSPLRTGFIKISPKTGSKG